MFRVARLFVMMKFSAGVESSLKTLYKTFFPLELFSLKIRFIQHFMLGNIYFFIYYLLRTEWVLVITNRWVLIYVHT